MKKEKILEIFYKEVIEEARIGSVDCYSIFNTIFRTIIEGKVITECELNNEYLLIPTLVIKNKDRFDNNLIKYVELALDFYKGNFIDLPNNLDSEKIYIKSIETLLWSDATSEDFLNPEDYLIKKIHFISDQTFVNDNFIDSFNTSLGTLSYTIKKDKIFNETPYYMEFKINDDTLPLVRYGIHNNEAYIYAIHNKTKNRSKLLNRSLYKVNKGIDFDEEKNIKDITPSTLLSALLAISLLKSKGINKIIIPSFLPVRWNAKEIMYLKKANYKVKEGYDKEKIIEQLTDSQQKHIDIQKNLTDKFLRTFMRLDYHFSNINIISIPFMNSIDMHIEVSDEFECNNKLLEELYTSFHKQKNYKKIL